MSETQITKTETKVPAEVMPGSALKALLHGDWAGVTEQDQLRYTQAVCKALSIPTPLNPFRLITLNGKKVLYAGAEVTRLLAERNNLSVQIVKIYTEKETQIHTVEVRAVQKDGRYTDDVGSLYIGGLSGQALANAKMKTITKAKRRAVLSFCGLSVLDDDDIAQMNKGVPVEGYGPSMIRSDFNPDTGEAALDVETPPPSEEDEETKEHRKNLFNALVGKGGKFPGKPDEAHAFILETTGKQFSDLSLNELVDVQAALANGDLNEGEPGAE